MIFATFIFYFILFIVISYPSLKNGAKSRAVYKVMAIPALLGVVMVFLTVIKVYFVYKFIMLVFVAFTGLLTYWQWGDQIRRWWK